MTQSFVLGWSLSRVTKLNNRRQFAEWLSHERVSSIFTLPAVHDADSTDD